MAIFKRQICKQCKTRLNVKEPKKRAPKCRLCGGETYYLSKWYISYGNNGHKKTVRAVSEDREEAVRVYAEAVLQSGTYEEAASNNSINGLINAYMTYCQKRVDAGLMAKKTLQGYRSRLAFFEPMMNSRIDLVMIHIRKNLHSYVDDRIGVKTNAALNREVAMVKRFISFLRHRGVVQGNPLEDFPMLPEKKIRDNVLTDVQFNDLLMECSPELKICVQIAWYTGLRLNSILNLKWSDIDFKENMITARVVKHVRSSGDKVLEVPMTSTLACVLASWKSSRKVLSHYVLPSPTDPRKPRNPSSDMGFKRATIKAGLNGFRFHDLRHCFATYFLSRTKDLPTLAAIMGHSPTEQYRMSLRYAHILKEDKIKAMEAFENL